MACYAKDMDCPLSRAILNMHSPPKKWLKSGPKKISCDGRKNLKCYCNTFKHWCATCGYVGKPTVQIDPLINGQRFFGVHRVCGFTAMDYIGRETVGSM